MPVWPESLLCWGLAGRCWCILYRGRLRQRCQVLMCFCPGKVLSLSELVWLPSTPIHFAWLTQCTWLLNSTHPLPFAASVLFSKHRDWPQCPCNLVRLALPKSRQWRYLTVVSLWSWWASTASPYVRASFAKTWKQMPSFVSFIIARM